jgi:hypothetical protein
MSYVPEIRENRKFHNKYHDEAVHGLRVPEIRSDRIIWEQDIQRIVVVNFQSTAVQKERAEGIGRLAHLDSIYDFAPYSSAETLDFRNVHLFLGHVADRGISLFLVEKREHVWKCTWQDYHKRTAQKIPNHAPVWSVGQVWVQRNHRRRGWARRLAEQASHFFTIDIQSLGWHTPFTKEGEAMIRRLCPDWFYVAK